MLSSACRVRQLIKRARKADARAEYHDIGYTPAEVDAKIEARKALAKRLEKAPKEASDEA